MSYSVDRAGYSFSAAPIAIAKIGPKLEKRGAMGVGADAYENKIAEYVAMQALKLFENPESNDLIDVWNQEGSANENEETIYTSKMLDVLDAEENNMRSLNIVRKRDPDVRNLHDFQGIMNYADWADTFEMYFSAYRNGNIYTLKDGSARPYSKNDLDQLEHYFRYQTNN